MNVIIMGFKNAMPYVQRQMDSVLQHTQAEAYIDDIINQEQAVRRQRSSCGFRRQTLNSIMPFPGSVHHGTMPDSTWKKKTCATRTLDPLL